MEKDKDKEKEKPEKKKGLTLNITVRDLVDVVALEAEGLPLRFSFQFFNTLRHFPSLKGS